MDNKTILLLGGASQQLIAIEKAKELGYRTVLCDYLSDNPGQFLSDVFYQVSTTDKEAVLEVAKAEKVGGVLAYASDPAAPTAAYVGECLGLPSNSFTAVETLSNKALFRNHLAEHGFACPKVCSFTTEGSWRESLTQHIENFVYPLVVKPTDSSGSKGITIIDSVQQLEHAVDIAANISRNNLLVVEEYIESSHEHIIGGDIFVSNGQITFFGLMDCIRDRTAELVPAGKCMPTSLRSVELAKIEGILQDLVNSLNIVSGEFNVELIVGQDNQIFILEMGARAGGNMIPVLLSDISRCDLVAANIYTAMGEMIEPPVWRWTDSDEKGYLHVLHSTKSGVYEGYRISERLRGSLYREVMYLNKGDQVFSFDGADKAIGILFFRFNSSVPNDEIGRLVQNEIEVKVQ